MYNDLFAADTYVPISEYNVHDGSCSYMEIKVRKDILEALIERGSSITAARYTDDAVTYMEVRVTDAAQGIVRIDTSERGVYIIVCEELRHSFPVITNWDASLNRGRGGIRQGGTDGIGELRLNRESGDLVTELPLRDEQLSNPYLYRTDAYALFEDESAGEVRRVPAYERYIGETYSLLHVTEEAVLKLSDQSLKLTGYPVVLRHYEVTVDKLEEGVPAFQLVHGDIIGEGEHRSMVSFILPPYWSRAQVARYPAVFSGFYDQNENVFSTVGPPLLKVLGSAFLQTGKGAVGIIWNGGGSIGTRTLQDSIYDNMNDLFRMAVERFAVDSDAIVAVGGSRGGVTGLLAAGNPRNSGYSIPYLVCYNPPLFFSDPMEEILNTTFPVRWEAIRSDIGYKDAWRPNWLSTDGSSAIELFLRNQFGTSDSRLIGIEHGPSSDRIIRTLQEKGTKVWFTHGTHDAFTASWPGFEWVNRARRYGVQVRHEIGYRFGHNNCTHPFDRATECLVSLLTGEQLQAEGTWHYRRSSERAEEWEQAERFEPERQPVYFEGPKVVVKGLPMYLVLYGEPGMEYRLELLDQSEGLRMEAILLMEGVFETLEDFGEAFSFKKSIQEVNEQLVPGLYAYHLQFRRSGTIDWIKPVHVPHPGRDGIPVLEVLGEIPNFTDEAWFEKTMRNSIGWGLSEA
ncbi:hypothetical protein Back11_33870 [Paenibacillus baekrokdamisoli]|uniref:Uncharacterized protein n=1 Tax=Paenibacillus baekrokdamisoli TaxID=1712516 RepID=A0A3G9IV02_9BACL|nr:hypothetical protein [Paenibacillus baekrokdamisoli]MBB3073369.1 hypothetical protein [Paenibacillus baekrokdamisoli]BBH22042.1 hypothetical protein Back11_33870 [Paenibacillus baekrokdamisoli]